MVPYNNFNEVRLLCCVSTMLSDFSASVTQRYYFQVVIRITSLEFSDLYPSSSSFILMVNLHVGKHITSEFTVPSRSLPERHIRSCGINYLPKFPPDNSQFWHISHRHKLFTSLPTRSTCTSKYFSHQRTLFNSLSTSSNSTSEQADEMITTVPITRKITKSDENQDRK